jgi:hypothetical protein
MTATTRDIGSRRAMYRLIRDLPEEKAARVMSYIKSLQEEEPPLSEDEEEGLRQAYAELASGQGERFREVFKELL